MQSILEKTVAQVAEHYGVAGGAVVVVRDGKTIFKQPFGLADAATGRPVTAQSYFDIASNSKAFTTMLWGLLCDLGKVDWDTPIRKWWPDFRMVDEYAAAHLTARDMACHRSGLSRHDLIRRSRPEDLPSRQDYVERVAHYVPSAGFREKHQYQNQVYAALGYLEEQICGKTWEDMVREWIAEPLGMEVEFRGLTDLAGKDAALPHNGSGSKPIPRDYNMCWVNNPCGGIKTNLDSMEKWVTMLATGGKYPNGEQFISQQQYREFCSGVIAAGAGTPWNPEDKNASYGLGWKVSTYRGQHLVQHGGSIQGFNSNVGFFPELGIGYAVMVNAGGTCLHEVLRYLLCDIGLGCVQEDYSDLLQIQLKKRSKPLAERVKNWPKLPVSENQLEKFAGHYWNDGYHDLYVEADGRPGLTVAYGQDKAELYQVEEGLFQGIFEEAGIFADCRFAPDGKTAVMSYSEKYSPTLFHKVK